MAKPNATAENGEQKEKKARIVKPKFTHVILVGDNVNVLGVSDDLDTVLNLMDAHPGAKRIKVQVSGPRA